MLNITRDADGRVTHIHSDGHVVLTGPIRGNITLKDGTTIDVTGEAVEAESPEQAAEIAHQVGLRYEAEGHPDDVEVDVDTGKLVQQRFIYVAPAQMKGKS